MGKLMCDCVESPSRGLVQIFNSRQCDAPADSPDACVVPAIKGRAVAYVAEAGHFADPLVKAQKIVSRPGRNQARQETGQAGYGSSEYEAALIGEPLIVLEYQPQQACLFQGLTLVIESSTVICCSDLGPGLLGDAGLRAGKLQIGDGAIRVYFQGAAGGRCCLAVVPFAQPDAGNRDQCAIVSRLAAKGSLELDHRFAQMSGFFEQLAVLEVTQHPSVHFLLVADRSVHILREQSPGSRQIWIDRNRAASERADEGRLLLHSFHKGHHVKGLGVLVVRLYCLFGLYSSKCPTPVFQLNANK